MSVTAEDLAVGAEAPYWDGLPAGKLRLQCCVGCNAWHWPAVWRCSDCGSWEHRWEDVAMTGTIYTWSRNRHRFGGQDALELPFVTVVVTLDGGGGARLMGLLDTAERVAIGARVAGRVGETPYDDRTVPAIRWSLA